VLSPRDHGAKLGSKIIEGWLGFTGQSLAQNFTMLRFRRTPMPSGSPLQPGNKIVIEIANTETGGPL